MRKYLIPISMTIGAIIGIIVGSIIGFGVDVFLVVGAALGVVVGSIIQMIINEITPDELYKSSSNIEKISSWNKIEAEKLEENNNGQDSSGNLYEIDPIGDTKIIKPINNNDYIPPKKKKRSIPRPEPNEAIISKKHLIIEEEED